VLLKKTDQSLAINQGIGHRVGTVVDRKEVETEVIHLVRTSMVIGVARSEIRICLLVSIGGAVDEILILGADQSSGPMRSLRSSPALP